MPALAFCAALALPSPAASPGAARPAHRVVFEVTSSRPEDWVSAVRRIRNLQKSLAGGLELELVAYGPGLSILDSAKTNVAAELAALRARGVRLAACSNSMRAMKVPESRLVPGARPVDSGAAESVRRQEEGWSVLRVGAE